MPYPVPSDVHGLLRFVHVDPRGVADFHYVADGPESIKVAMREKAFDSVPPGGVVYEAVASFDGLLLGLLFSVQSEAELRSRLTVLEVLGS